MKRLKAVALTIIGAFFAFAPPGTLIVIALLIAGWTGIPVLIGAIVGLAVLGGGWLWMRARKRRKP